MQSMFNVTLRELVTEASPIRPIEIIIIVNIFALTFYLPIHIKDGK